MSLGHKISSMLSALFSAWVICRGCLKSMPDGGEAGLCASCWSGLWPLAEDRCPRCALAHGAERACPDEVSWEYGDALWNYKGGRPAMGMLLVPGIKSGEKGWRLALLRRVSSAELPGWAGNVDLVTSVPPSPWHKLMRGFDLAGEAAQLISKKTARPYTKTMSRAWFSKRQAKQTESQRRRMPQKNMRLRRNADVSGKIILLVDDVWTTGTTLLRCARTLLKSGAKEVRVISLFRAV